MPDCLFPSNNEYGIPTLDLSMCAEYCDLPVIGWGTQRRTDKMNGTWHFYVDDYRFNALWTKPDKLIATGCINLIEPNFSVYQQTPKALSIWQVYRKRWLSRYWQRNGIKIIVDMNVNKDYQDINIMGVPDGWYSFATRGYTDRWKDVIREYKTAGEIAGDNVGKLMFLVYGGGKTIKKLCGDNNLVWIPEQEDDKHE